MFAEIAYNTNEIKTINVAIKLMTYNLWSTK